MEQITAELKICALLQECSRESVITSSQFVQGFLVPSRARLMTLLLTFFMHLGPEGISRSTISQSQPTFSSDLDTSVIYPQWGMKNVFRARHFSFNPSGICCRVQNTNLPNCCRGRGLGFRVQGKTGGADDHSLIPSLVIESLWLYGNQRRPAYWRQRWGPIIQDFFVFSLIGEFVRSPRDLAMHG